MTNTFLFLFKVLILFTIFRGALFSQTGLVFQEDVGMIGDAFIETSSQGSNQNFGQTIDLKSGLYSTNSTCESINPSHQGFNNELFGHDVGVSGNFLISGSKFSPTCSGGDEITFREKSTCSSWIEVAALQSSDISSGDQFGYSVAISGSFALAGAPEEDEDLNGMNSMVNTGSAYVFQEVGGIWSEIQKVSAFDRMDDDHFGFSVAMNDQYLVIGSPNSDLDENGNAPIPDAGAAYIYEFNGSNWVFIQKIVSPFREADDQFGYSVEIYNDNIIVGAPFEDHDVNETNYLDNSGSAYIFSGGSGTFLLSDKIVSHDRMDFNLFGTSVGLISNYAVVGAPFQEFDASGGNQQTESGAIYVFENTGNWQQTNKLVASDRSGGDRFGSSVGIDDDSGVLRIVASSPFQVENYLGLAPLASSGGIYIFMYQNPNWNEIQIITPSNRYADAYFGFAVDMEQGISAVGSPGDETNKGYTYTFDHNTTTSTDFTDRILLKPDIDHIPSNVIVLEATLTLKPDGSAHNISSSTASYLSRIITDWSENTVNWTNQPNISNGDQISVQAATSTSQTINIDVKNQIVKILENPGENFGFQLRLQNESSGSGILVFASKEHVNSSLRPNLHIEYMIVNYAEMSSGTDGTYYQPYQDPNSLEYSLFIKYEEKYIDGNLMFNIYDESNSVVVSSSTAKSYGPNWIELNLSSMPALILNNYYLLEVLNEKGKPQYLRFKYNL